MFLLLDLLLEHFTSFIQLMLCNLGGTRRLSNGTTFKCATQNRAPACICFPLPAAFASSASASTFNSCFRARSSASLRSFSSYKIAHFTVENLSPMRQPFSAAFSAHSYHHRPNKHLLSPSQCVLVRPEIIAFI
jgi:hypothetical protein